jgi:hypothetical protein
VKDSLFLALLKRERVPIPTEEFRFAPPRRWRFDYAWPCELVALEVEGGAWSRGRHTRGKGFLADMEKYNRATEVGWMVFRVTPKTLCTLETIEMIRIGLDLRASQAAKSA